MENSCRVNYRKLSKFRRSFNGVCVLVLFFFFCYREEILQNPFPNKPFPNLSQKPNTNNTSLQDPVFRRRIYQTTINSSNVDEELESNSLQSIRNPTICSEIHQHKGYNSKCDYLRDNPECNSGGFLNYMVFFFCSCSSFEPLGYIVLAIWLLTLLYMLGNTAADYFCCSLEKLSCLLKLSPTVAGVTLLPLGNGAPDVFASIAAFVGRDSGDVGFNSILGGAVFVTCIVVGTVSLYVAQRNVQIDKKCFIRDVGFFIVALVSLLVILAVGKLSLGGAIAFVLIYAVYALCVAASEMLKKDSWRSKLESVIPLLAVTGSVLSGVTVDQDESERATPLLDHPGDGVPHLQAKLPRWLWASNVAIYSNETAKTSNNESPKYLWGWNEDDDTVNDQSFFSCSKLCSLLEIPLAIPRRLTIPMVEEDRWSKTYAVASASLAPVLLAVLWSTGDSNIAKMISYLIGAVVGGVFGLLTLIYTKTDHPPRKFLLPWVLGGFLMSIVWFYIVANELVALLVALGVILRIKASLLALTILAWGNSMGDLMSNVAIALNGRDGVQIAVSGCYAGPMFNTLVGLGVSLLLGAWSKMPASYAVPRDRSLYSTLGFLILGLLWALVMLPRNDMRPSKSLGVGLMVIYVVFLAVKATIAMGGIWVH